MALWNSMALWKRLEGLFPWSYVGRVCTLAPSGHLNSRWGGTRRERRRLAVEGLEHRLCPSPVLLVVDGNGNQVLAYDAHTGAFRQVFVSPGSGGLDAPDLGIIGGPDGNVYVDSYGSGDSPVNSVMRYQGTTGNSLPSGIRTGANFVTPNDGGLQGSEGLAFGPDGFLYVANDTTQPTYGGVPGNILRFDGVTGDFVSVFVSSGSGGLSYANDLHFGPDGNLYVSNGGGAGPDHGKILRYDASTGNPLPSAGRDGANFIAPNDGGLTWANGFAFGPDGMLYVANDFTANGPSNILRFDATTGNFVDVFVSGGLGFIDGIVWGPDGNLYVTSNTADQASVNRYDASGNLLGVFVAPNDGGLQFAAGLLFWDLPDASPPPGGGAGLIPLGNPYGTATPGSVAGPLEPTINGSTRVVPLPADMAHVDGFAATPNIQDHLLALATAKRGSSPLNANEATGITHSSNVPVDQVFAALSED